MYGSFFFNRARLINQDTYLPLPHPLPFSIPLHNKSSYSVSLLVPLSPRFGTRRAGVRSRRARHEVLRSIARVGEGFAPRRGSQHGSYSLSSQYGPGAGRCELYCWAFTLSTLLTGTCHISRLASRQLRRAPTNIKPIDSNTRTYTGTKNQYEYITRDPHISDIGPPTLKNKTKQKNTRSLFGLL